MTDLDDRALTLVLDDASIPTDDVDLAQAVARARRDVERIRLGITLVATQEAIHPSPRQRRRVVPAVAAAAAVLVAAGVVGLARSEGDSNRGPVAAPTTTSTGLAPSLGAPGPTLTLDQRVAQADRIVIGEITKIDRGDVGGLPYVMATVHVTETIKGAPARDVVAFDYDLGGATTSSDAPSMPWNIGDEVLLFLASDAGTVSEDLQPAHLQVAEGASGRYAVTDGEITASFTLEDVRAAAE